MSSLTHSLKSFPYRDVPLKLRPLLLKRVGIDDYLRLLGVDRGLREYALNTGPFSRQITAIWLHIHDGRVVRGRLLATSVTINIIFRDGCYNERDLLPWYEYLIEPTEKQLLAYDDDWKIPVPIAKSCLHLFNKITMCQTLLIQPIPPFKMAKVTDEINPREDVIKMIPWIRCVHQLKIFLPNVTTEFLLDHLHPQVSNAIIHSSCAKVDEMPGIATTIRSHFSNNCLKIKMESSSVEIFEAIIRSKTIRTVEYALHKEQDFKDLVMMILSLDSPIQPKFILTYSSINALDDQMTASDLGIEIEEILLAKTQPLLIEEREFFNFDNHYLNEKMLISEKSFKRELNPCVDSIFQLMIFEEAFKFKQRFHFH